MSAVTHEAQTNCGRIEPGKGVGDLMRRIRVVSGKIGKAIGWLVYPDGLENGIRKEQAAWYRRKTVQGGHGKCEEEMMDWWGDKNQGTNR